MTISLLRINQFRNVMEAQLSPVRHGLNIICGNNGSGKTSLLEAIYYLGHGKSFRSSVSSRLINHQSEKFSLYTQIVTPLQRQVPIGVERDASTTKYRIDEADSPGLAEIASYLPIRMINSQSHQLLEGGPVFRRKFLDWGLFYQSSEFMNVWRHYERALKQRNAILRDRRSRQELAIWTNELASYGEALDRLRKDYLAQFIPHAQHFAAQLLSQSTLVIDYQSGWKDGETFEQVLHATIDDDFRAGFTQAGPHRADFDMLANGLNLKHVLSRGQQKLLICAMILAQGMMLVSQDNQGLIYLVDDLPSELDLLSRQKLVSLLAMQASQIFITSIEKDDICDLVSDKSNVPMRVFHVEHGKIELRD